MAAVCFYFQVHQPYRLRRYSIFDGGRDYFADTMNREVMEKVTGKCYLRANAVLRESARRYGNAFKVGMSLSGVAVEQMEKWSPQALDSFQDIAATGCVEFLGETYHHSLSSLYSAAEFRDQVSLHAQLMERVFAQRLLPKKGGAKAGVFRNTELIYNDAIAQEAGQLGFGGILCEGVERVLEKRSAGRLYEGNGGVKVLLRNFAMSDDVAFRFGHSGDDAGRLTAEVFARRVGEFAAAGDEIVNVFMDYETFGEHQWEETGIFDFLTALPAALFEAGHEMVMPGEAIRRFAATEPLEVAGGEDEPEGISWADTEKDISAWTGNAMQRSATNELYHLEAGVKAKGDPVLLDDWRRLTTSDHVYYMSTKHYGDGEVHAYFSPFESPYDAYIAFMNVLDNLRGRMGRPLATEAGLLKEQAAEEPAPD